MQDTEHHGNPILAVILDDRVAQPDLAKARRQRLRSTLANEAAQPPRVLLLSTFSGHLSPSRSGNPSKSGASA